MGYTITKVLNSFIRNSPERLSTSNHSFSLIDGALYSYHEKIAYRDNNHVHLFNKTSKGMGFFSNTTSTHVNRVLNCLMAKKIDFTIHNKDDEAYEEDD